MLRSRDGQRSAIARLLDSARQGHGGGVVLRGEPGIGKSALLANARERVVDLRVLQATAVEAEENLGYAILHQLLRPLQLRTTELPRPQRQALRVAIGLEAGSPPDRFLISLAELTLLSEAADQQPILCILDDTVGGRILTGGRPLRRTSSGVRGDRIARRRSIRRGSRIVHDGWYTGPGRGGADAPTCTGPPR